MEQAGRGQVEKAVGRAGAGRVGQAERAAGGWVCVLCLDEPVNNQLELRLRMY